jgi:hypothetical protein
VLDWGNTEAMQDGEGVWLEAAAGIQSGLDADLRAEAFEVYVAEAARMRMQDRVGTVRLSLRCGHAIEGEITGDDAIGAHLRLRDDSGRHLVVPVGSITRMSGSRPGPRIEGGDRTVTSWLRERWAVGDLLRLLTRDGTWIVGALTHVGADHVDVVVGGETTTVPLEAVDAWSLA